VDVFAYLVRALKRYSSSSLSRWHAGHRLLGPEPPFSCAPNWCKSLAYFCKQFPLPMHNILPRVGDCLGVDKRLTCKTESGALPCFLGAASHLLISASCMCRLTMLRVSPVIFRLVIHILHLWSEIICCSGTFMCFVSSRYWFASLSIASFRRPYVPSC
jgi:hypothetical protein